MSFPIVFKVSLMCLSHQSVQRRAEDLAVQQVQGGSMNL